MAKKQTTFIIELDWQPSSDAEYRKLMHLWDALTAACAATVSDPVLSVIEPRTLNIKLITWMKAHGHPTPKCGEVVVNGNDSEIIGLP
jgi:hypothetical protein